MRKPVVGVALTLLLLAASVPLEASPIIATGDTVRLADSYGNTGGGEFIMTVNNSFSFITFCLQRTQYIDFTHTFRVDGVTNYATFEPVASGGNLWGRDYLSSQTAYLYTNFRNHTLTGYNFSGTSAQRTASANALQNAIWMLENELPMNLNNQFVQRANAAVSSGQWNGIGDVKVLNLSRNGVGAQDQIALQVPGSSSLALVAFGLTLLTIVRRRRTARVTA